MSPETLATFGLSTEPFTKEIDDADLWLPPSKQSLLDELVEAAEARKIELQQARLVAAAQHAQDQRSIDALQAKAAEATVLAAQLDQLKEAIHATPVSHACLASPAGRAFSAWLHDSGGIVGAAPDAAAQPMAVSGSARSGP